MGAVGGEDVEVARARLRDHDTLAGEDHAATDRNPRCLDQRTRGGLGLVGLGDQQGRTPTEAAASTARRVKSPRSRSVAHRHASGGEFRSAQGNGQAESALFAHARPIHSGRNITHDQCDIVRSSDAKTVATVTGTVMTLRGDQAAGR